MLVTVSKETTCITEPLRPDGYPDYIAALNGRNSDGVTPENNAVVPVFRAMGPGVVDEKFRDQYCKMLGIAPPPERGEYFVAVDVYAKTLKPAKPADRPDVEIRGQSVLAAKRPWRAGEFPLVAGWLAAQEQPLDRVVAASKRPRWFVPLVSGEDGTVLDALMPSADPLREAGWALAARAMRRLQDGKIDQAWSDLLAVHRLARLGSHGPILVDGLMAAGLNDVACTGDQALLQHARLTAAEAAKMRADLAALLPLAKMVDKIDVGERFMILDATAMLARGKGSAFQEFNKISTNTAAVDWNMIFRMTNKLYDRIVAAAGQPTRAQRENAWRDVDADRRNQIKAATGWKSLVASELLDPRQGISERIGLIMISIFLPDVGALMKAEDRGNMRFELTKLAFALAEYRAHHGSYPAQLADLVPKYVAAVPQDIFSGGALHYTLQGDGYLLYSVGPNGKDDGGRNREDNPDDYGCDDIAVRIVPK